MKVKKTIYTRSECKLYVAGGCLFALIAVSLFIYGVMGKLLSMGMRVGLIGASIYLVFEACRTANTPSLAMRYMDIHQVDSVSGEDLKEWMKQQK